MIEPQVGCVACPGESPKSDPTALVPRSLWPACQNSVTALRFLQETVEGLDQSPALDTQVLGPCWELMALGTQGSLPLDRGSKDTQTRISQKGHRLQPSGTPPAPPQRRPRKQLNPCRGTEKVDPGFEGVTLRFQIKPDASLLIIPSYSLPCSSRSQEPPAETVEGPAAHPGDTEALGEPRWADHEVKRSRYKKYGTRCSSCWLVPRKNVQPKKLCGRCGVSLDPIQEG
uniref:Zinc finger GATA like protein 1 n=1 Tax=Cebus imitator TaxID=2715852 RepID=A0A2K5RFH4_CEBIM